MGNYSCCTLDIQENMANSMPQEHVAVAKDKREKSVGGPTIKDIENSVILWIKF